MNRYMIDKVSTLEEGISNLFGAVEKEVPSFEFKRSNKDEFSDILVFGGKEYPVLTERYDVRIREISNYGKDPTKNSALNVYSFVGCDISLDEHIFKELSIAEHILNSKIVKITAVVNKNAANIIALTEDKATANLDLGNTLAEGSRKQCQHRLITKHGMANDIAVGTVTAVSQINVFKTCSQAPETYDDDEYYLLGLSETDITRACAAFAVLTGNADTSELGETYKRLKAAVRAVHISDEKSCPVYIKDVSEVS